MADRRIISKAMPDKPSRSVFVPLLFVGVLLAIAGLIVVLVPFRKCAVCEGIGVVLYVDGNLFPIETLDGPFDISAKGSNSVNCSTCLNEGEVSLLKYWFSRPPDLGDFFSPIVDCYKCKGTGKHPDLGTAGGCAKCVGKGSFVEYRARKVKPIPR